MIEPHIANILVTLSVCVHSYVFVFELSVHWDALMHPSSVSFYLLSSLQCVRERRAYIFLFDFFFSSLVSPGAQRMEGEEQEIKGANLSAKKMMTMKK